MFVRLTEEMQDALHEQLDREAARDEGANTEVVDLGIKHGSVCLNGAYLRRDGQWSTDPEGGWSDEGDLSLLGFVVAALHLWRSGFQNQAIEFREKILEQEQWPEWNRTVLAYRAHSREEMHDKDVQHDLRCIMVDKGPSWAKALAEDGVQWQP